MQKSPNSRKKSKGYFQAGKLNRTVTRFTTFYYEVEAQMKLIREIDAANRIGVCRSTLRNWAKRGRINVLRMDGERTIRYDENEINNLFKAKK